MRIGLGLALTLGMSFPLAGMVSRQQDPANAENPAGQTAPTPAAKETAPAGQAPAEAAPVPAKTGPASATRDKTDAGTASAGRASARSSGPPSKRRKRSPAPAPDGAPRRIVVREGGASEPAAQIVPGMTPAEAARERQNAEQLLRTADDQLKQLAGRTLGAQQRETVGQIRNYMDGARAALQEGDVRRGDTLAQKAHLLSSDLLHH